MIKFVIQVLSTYQCCKLQLSCLLETLNIVFQKKTGPSVISSYLCSDSYKFHENFQKYIRGVVCCEYEINVCDSLTVLC